MLRPQSDSTEGVREPEQGPREFLVMNQARTGMGIRNFCKFQHGHSEIPGVLDASRKMVFALPKARQIEAVLYQKSGGVSLFSIKLDIWTDLHTMSML